MQLTEELARLFALLSKVTSDQQRQANLTRLEYLVLGRLQRSGAMRAGDLAQQEGLEQSTLSRRIGLMEERGLVRRQVDPADRRAQLLELTKAGRKAHEAESGRRIKLITEVVADWPDADRDELGRLLEELNNALQQRITL